MRAASQLIDDHDSVKEEKGKTEGDKERGREKASGIASPTFVSTVRFEVAGAGRRAAADTSALAHPQT